MLARVGKKKIFRKSFTFLVKSMTSSFTSYLGADMNPVARQEWDLSRPPNMMHFDYGQTMRYHEAEQTERQMEIKRSRDNEHHIVLGQQYFEFEGVARSEVSTDDWQPWMQRSGIPVAQQRIMDLPAERQDGAHALHSYAPQQVDNLDLDNGYQMMANDNSVYRSHRIDQYQPQNSYE